MRKTIVSVGSALAVAAALTLTGCGSDSAQRSPGTGLESVLGGGGNSGNSDSGNSGGTSSGESRGGSSTPDVNVNMNGSIPDGWPREVIVPEGEITFSGTVDDGFSLIMTAKKSAVEAAIDQLQSNGFSVQTNFMGEQGGVVALENADWNVGLLVGSDNADGDEWSVIYTVTPR